MNLYTNLRMTHGVYFVLAAFSLLAICLNSPPVFAQGPSVNLEEVGGAQAATLNAHCDEGKSLQGQIDKAAAGDTILVHGTCKESTIVPAHKPGLVIDGQNSAVIENTGHTGVRILSLGVTVKNITVQGGSFGIVVVSGSAHVDNSTIRLANSIGVVAQSNGALTLTKSTVENNRRSGIEATTGGFIEVGVISRPGSESGGNLIQNNGIFPDQADYPFATGVKAKRNSHLTVTGNTIVGNSGGGVSVRENSFALISNNVIEKNGSAAPDFIGGGFGISVKEHSNVDFWRDTSDGPVNYPNTTRAGFENSGYGFNCGGLSSFEAGFFSTYPNGSKAEGLKGTKGDLDIADSCDGAFHKPGRGPAAH